MDTITLVDDQIDEGQIVLNGLRDVGFPFVVACWVKPGDEDRWSLYIASSVVEARGLLAAYRQVIDVLRSSDVSWVTSSDVKLIGDKHPFAQEVLTYVNGSRHWEPRRPPFMLGGISVDDIYVYPLETIEVKIYGLTFHEDPSPSLHLSFEPHDPHMKITIGSREFCAESPSVWTVAAPAGAAFELNSLGRKTALIWNLRGRRVQFSSANEVWSLAKEGRNGFRFLREPGQTGATAS